MKGRNKFSGKENSKRLEIPTKSFWSVAGKKVGKFLLSDLYLGVRSKLYRKNSEDVLLLMKIN